MSKKLYEIYFEFKLKEQVVKNVISKHYKDFSNNPSHIYELVYAEDEERSKKVVQAYFPGFDIKIKSITERKPLDLDTN